MFAELHVQVWAARSNLPGVVPGERGAALVIAGLDPAIHPFREMLFRRVMDTRVKPAYDK
jgi:hypothetical protein